MSVSLLSTKIHIPSLRTNSISRPRLTEKVLAGVKRPGTFVLLSGPAGFGKTTLLSEFVAGYQRPVAWVSLDEADNDPIRFWAYLIAACHSMQDNIGEAALALLQTPQQLPEETIPTILINDIQSSDIDFVVVLDDFHTIQNQSIDQALSFLLDHIPDNLHLVLSTRVHPPWPLTRLRARNQLIEIRAADLRFTTEETAAFLNQVMGLNLSAEEVAALDARTEGWIASLQLAAISMQGRSDINGFVKAFAGSNVYVAEYLIEEVLGHQQEEMKIFLLQTSILERLNASLCEAVSGRPDSQAILNRPARRSLIQRVSPKRRFSMNQRPTGLNVTKAMEGFLHYKSAEGLSPVTVTGYDHDLKLWIEYQGDVDVAAVETTHILAYLNYLRTDYVPPLSFTAFSGFAARSR